MTMLRISPRDVLKNVDRPLMMKTMPMMETMKTSNRVAKQSLLGAAGNGMNSS
jgi:hypothetical protein